MVTPRGRVALAAGAAARWASRVTGRGAGAMIGGLIAMRMDRCILTQLGRGRRTVVITGTNGKSTTTRMTAAALGTLGPVATNAEGANMDAGLVAALAAAPGARLAALEVDEMHVPHVLDAVDAAVVVLLNLSRDQLDRVGEINHIERTLRAGLARHPGAVVVANCDDVLMTSAAYDSADVVWVAAGGGWAGDSVSCPRSGEIIVREQSHWYSTGCDFKRPSPHWWFDDAHIHGPDGLALPMTLTLPGTVNRGNATQAVAAAVALGADPAAAVAAVSAVDEVAGQVPDGADRFAHRAGAAGQEPGGLAGGAVDGRPQRRRRGDRGQRTGARRRGPVLAVGCALRALRLDRGGGSRRARHRPGGAAGLRRRRAHPGARHHARPSSRAHRATSKCSPTTPRSCSSTGPWSGGHDRTVSGADRAGAARRDGHLR